VLYKITITSIDVNKEKETIVKFDGTFFGGRRG